MGPVEKHCIRESEWSRQKSTGSEQVLAQIQQLATYVTHHRGSLSSVKHPFSTEPTQAEPVREGGQQAGQREKAKHKTPARDLGCSCRALELGCPSELPKLRQGDQASETPCQAGNGHRLPEARGITLDQEVPFSPGGSTL